MIDLIIDEKASGKEEMLKLMREAVSADEFLLNNVAYGGKTSEDKGSKSDSVIDGGKHCSNA